MADLLEPTSPLQNTGSFRKGHFNLDLAGPQTILGPISRNLMKRKQIIVKEILESGVDEDNS